MQNNVDIAALFNRHAATVYRLCYSFLGSAADAEDATQSVFMKLMTARAGSTMRSTRRHGS